MMTVVRVTCMSARQLRLLGIPLATTQPGHAVTGRGGRRKRRRRTWIDDFFVAWSHEFDAVAPGRRERRRRAKLRRRRAAKMFAGEWARLRSGE